MHITFPYYHIELDLPAGTTVHEACRMAGHPLHTACGGMGVCGKCLAVIRHNGLTAQVLACQQEILPEMAILISPDNREEKLLTESAPLATFPVDPILRTYPVSHSALLEISAENQKTFFENLQDLLPISLAPLSCQRAYELHRTIMSPAPIINLLTVQNDAKNDEIILHLSAEDDLTPSFGMAFDIGTTSVAAYLLDLEEGRLMDSEAALNAQTAYGADVLSRITAGKKNDNALFELTAAIWKTLEQLIDSLCQRNHIEGQHLHALAYCGNAVMTHLLMMTNPALLGETPFLLVNKHSVFWQGTTLPYAQGVTINLPVSPHCFHLCLAGIGGLIGSDTTAVLTTLPSDGKCRLMIDLGTNCEIALGSNENYTVTSAACGPAFEGADITMGMRCCTGAIASCVYENNQLHFEIIGDKNTAAEGICGSGLIDCVAILLEIGVVLPDGSFAETLPNNRPKLSSRFGHTTTGECFFTLIASEENFGQPAVILTQKDIRAVQLAVAAIRTAWQLLLKHENIQAKDLEAIVLSGAFGASVNLKNAKKIGLIPDFDNVPVYSAGNGAGAGIQQVLLSRDALKKAEMISKCSHVINLAEKDDFNEAFMENLNFKL